MSEFTSFHTQLGADGRVVLPAQIRRELGLKPGDTIVAESDGQSLLLRSFVQVLREDQDDFRPFAQPGPGEADAPIAERRAGSARKVPSHG